MTRAQMKEQLAYSLAHVGDCPRIWWLSSEENQENNRGGMRKNMFNGLTVIVNEVF